MPKSKVSAFLSVLLVFASGAAMGAVGYRLYVVKTVTSSVPAAKKKQSPEEYRKLVMSQLKETVKLNDQQVEQVQKVYDWQGEQFMPIKKKADSQIEQVKHEFDQQRDQIHETAVAITDAKRAGSTYLSASIPRITSNENNAPPNGTP